MGILDNVFGGDDDNTEATPAAEPAAPAADPAAPAADPAATPGGDMPAADPAAAPAEGDTQTA